jgi:hypothetical protein
MNFFVTLTTACDLQCRYCYGECCDDFDGHDDGFGYDYFLPRSVTYETGALQSFLAKGNGSLQRTSCGYLPCQRGLLLTQVRPKRV